MLNIICGNVLALIAALLMVYTGILKDKKKIMFVQTIQIGMFSISNFVLGGIIGGIINALGCLKNILYSNNKLNVMGKIIITLVAIVMTIIFNNEGLIGYLPLINTIFYMWLMDVKNIIKFKILIIFTAILWLVYDFSINSFTSMIFDFMNITANIVTICQMIINNKYEKEKVYER